MRFRRVTRWTLGIVGGLLLLVATSAIVVETTWFKDRLRRIVVNRASEVLNGNLSIGELSGSLFTGIELHRVVLEQKGSPVLAVDVIALRYDPRVLIRGHLTFAELSLSKPVVHITQRADGWNIANLTKPTNEKGSTNELQFRKLTIVDGDLSVEPMGATARHFTHLNSWLGLSYSPAKTHVDLASLTAQDAATNMQIRAMSGKVNNSGDTLTASIDLDTTAGKLKAAADGRMGPNGRVVDAHIETSHVDMAPLLAREDLRSDLTGRVDAQTVLPIGGTPSSASFQVNAPALTAMGYSAQNVKVNGSYESGILHFDGSGSAFDATATLKGEWRTASAARVPNTLVVAGRVRDVDIRRMPASFQVPRLATRLAGQYSFSYSPAATAVILTFDRSTLENATIGHGTVAHVELRNGVPRYDARGHIVGLDLHRLAAPLKVGALRQPRFKSRITGDFDISGRGKTLNETVLNANVTLQDSTIGGTHVPSANIAANLDGRRLQVDFAGPFEHVNNELLGVGESTPIDLTGASDGVRVVFHDLSAPFDLTALDADANIRLDHSIIAGYDVDGATVSAAVADGAATVRDLQVAGAELQATAKGTVAFDSEQNSDLTFTLDAASLETAGKRFGQPLAGAAHVEGKVSGTPDHITLKGTLDAHQLKYATSVDALTLNSTFGAEVTNQQWRAISAHADTKASFLKLGGMDIEDMTATTAYRDGNLDVQTTIAQKDRTIQLAGAVLFEPEQEEVRLRQLGLTTKNQTWTLPSGRQAIIQYGQDRLSIKDLTLTHGAGSIGINGEIAMGQGPVATPGIDLKFDSVQLADLNQLAAGQYPVDGVLSGTAHVTGSTSAPEVASDFNISNGAVANTTFQGVTAKVGFRDNRLTVDTTVTQQPGAELHAAGTIPIALSKTADTTGNEPMDLRVESTPINLALFQPLTTHLTALKGTGQFNVHATGSLKDPRLDGDVSVANASFVVDPTNMSYTAGNARVRFNGDRIAIDQFSIEDDDRHVLTIEGGAQVTGGRDVQAVDLHVGGRDIHLLRNEFGEVGLDTDLRVSGEMRALNITGSLRVERGRLEVDKLLEKFNKTAYTPETDVSAAPDQPIRLPESPDDQRSAQPVENTTAAKPSVPAEQTQAATGSFFDNATMKVALHLPDDLVLRARDLRLTQGAAGLGSTNITLGGNLTLQKDAGAETTVLGRVEVVRGYYEFQGRRFDIVRGSELEFHGNVPIDPSLSVDAERDISGVTALVGVRGTAREPSLKLSSRPPLDESDVLSLIVFGQPVNSLGESQRVNLAQRAGSLALGAISGPLAESVANALNLDMFEIRAEGQGGGPEVSIGQQLGNRIYVGLRQEFGQEDVSTVQFEYRISRVLRLVTAVAQGVQQSHSTRRNDPTGADLIYVIRY